jgi:hypothetical protein
LRMTAHRLSGQATEKIVENAHGAPPTARRSATRRGDRRSIPAAARVRSMTPRPGRAWTERENAI